MDESVDDVREETMLSTLDASSRKSKVEMIDKDRNKMAFALHCSLQSFVKMQFGLWSLLKLSNAAGRG